VKALKEAKAGKGECKTAVEALTGAKEALAALEERARMKPGVPEDGGGAVDYSLDFFARQAFLTVSGQLQVRSQLAYLILCPVTQCTVIAANA